MTEMFGDDFAAWGEGEGGGASSMDDGPGSESLDDAIDLGGGIVLRIHPDVFRVIMHTPEITARVAARCEAISDAANELAVVAGARYKFTVSNRPENIRARGRVKPANVKAREDDDRNSTLLKALAQVGPTDHGDPHPYYEGGGEVPDGGEAGGPDMGGEGIANTEDLGPTLGEMYPRDEG